MVGGETLRPKCPSAEATPKSARLSYVEMSFGLQVGKGRMLDYTPTNEPEVNPTVVGPHFFDGFTGAL